MAENQIKIRPTLTQMRVGEETKFHISRLKSVRSQVSELGIILDRTYRTKTNRAERIVTVTRTA
ncbi:MAG: hypothetical protein K2J27_07895 [Duncaniella sp.]|nr:hypothetical protein [Duncaniella sp.]